MTRRKAEGRRQQAAVLTTDTEAGLPERLPWPAAAGVIAAVSLSLWGVIGFGVVWLIG